LNLPFIVVGRELAKPLTPEGRLAAQNYQRMTTGL